MSFNADLIAEDCPVPAQRDVTQRYDAEWIQSLLASIVGSSNNAIFSTRLDGTIVSWNLRSEVLFDYRGREVEGQCTHGTVHS